MPPFIDLNPYKDEILTLLSEKITHKAIRTLLQDKHHIKISRSGLKNRLREWHSTYPTPTSTFTRRFDIQDRVLELLPVYNISKILAILNKDGTPSLICTVRRIREDHKIKMRLSPFKRQ
jgi:hypothetical protein